MQHGIKITINTYLPSGCFSWRRLATSVLMGGLAGLLACSPQTETDTETATELTATTQDATLRSVSQGQLTGVQQDNGSIAWRGIPYAEPPVGKRRWQAPEPAQPWDGVLHADNHIPPCPQFASVLTAGVDDPDGDGIVGSEDCLYLSVYAPADVDPNQPLPVMYWIYGGGNNSGYADDYNGGVLAQKHNVIVVAVNYRLGSLGWFLHPAMVGEGVTGAAASGNWADLDMQLGLQWVQDNIAAFGGDSNNVTIFGESAGGANVMSLLISPRAEGLFHRAIVESGGVGTTPMHQAVNYADQEPAGHEFSSREIVNKILVRDGVAADRDEAKARQQAMSDAEIRELLYQQEVAEFLRLYNPEAERNYPAPKKFADGEVFVTTPPMEQLASGDFNQVPMMLGTNRDERRIYMYRDPQWVTVLKQDPAEYIRVAKFPSDAWKLRGVDDIARAVTQAQAGPVFAYRFDWDEQATYQGTDLSVAIGAGHATELAFVFGDWSVGFVPQEILYDEATIPGRNQLSEAMMSYWANFSYTGNPARGRSGELTQWQAWQAGEEAPKMLILDSENDGGIRMSTDTITAEQLKADFLAAEFSDPENRCFTYRATFARMGQFDRAEYRELGCDTQNNE